MTAEELKDIALCGETTTIQYKQEFTGQKEIAKEMIAFANTRGGKIIFGIKDKTGELMGLSYDDIQTISRELGNTANEQVRPTIYIDIEVVRADGKHFLVCTVEQGKNKPYTLSSRTMIYRGLGSGILRATRENVKVEFVNNESTNEFKTIVWRKDAESNVTSLSPVVSPVKLTERQQEILKLIQGNEQISAAEMSLVLSVAIRTIRRDLREMQEKGIITREGNTNAGRWIMTR